MSMLQIGILGVAGVLLALQFKSGKSEYGIYISIALGMLIFASLLGKISLLKDVLNEVSNVVGLNSDYFKTLWKILGITYAAEFSSAICKDAGYQTIALQIEVFAKITIADDTGISGMRYDMKYKKLNVEDNESCNLQCEKKCEKLAGVFICCILAFFLLFLSTRNVGLIYCYADELSEDSENTAEDAEQEQQEIKETILSEFEYGEIDDSLRSLFPEKRIAFQEVISEILTGDLKSSVKLLTEFAGEQMFYLLRTGKKNLVHILLIAMIAAFMNQFAGTLQNRQVASVGFYMIYILLAALTVAAFDVVIQWVESGIRNITAFMGVFYPVYFLAVAVAKGSVTGVAFYNLVLFLIYAVEIIIGNVLLPMVRVYMIIRVLNFLGTEDMLGKLSEFLELIIRWTLKTTLACVIGANLIQGMISPAIDTVKRSTVLKGAEAIPGVGNLLGGMTEVALGTAVLVKNGIGMTGAVICIALCVIPLVQTAGTALLYKLAAAVIQPVSDERVTGCVEAVGEGCQILLQIVFTVGVLFLLTIAIVAAVTNA